MNIGSNHLNVDHKKALIDIIPSKWYRKINYFATLGAVIAELEAAESKWHLVQPQIQEVFFWLCIQYYLNHVPLDKTKKCEDTKFAKYFLQSNVVQFSSTAKDVFAMPVGSGLHLQQANACHVFIYDGALVPNLMQAYYALPVEKASALPNEKLHFVFDAPKAGQNVALLPFTWHAIAQCTPNCHAGKRNCYQEKRVDETMNVAKALKNLQHAPPPQDASKDKETSISTPKPPYHGAMFELAFFKGKTNRGKCNCLYRLLSSGYEFSDGSVVIVNRFIENCLVLQVLLDQDFHQVLNYINHKDFAAKSITATIVGSCLTTDKATLEWDHQRVINWKETKFNAMEIAKRILHFMTEKMPDKEMVQQFDLKTPESKMKPNLSKLPGDVATTTTTTLPESLSGGKDKQQHARTIRDDRRPEKRKRTSQPHSDDEQPPKKKK